MLRSVTLSVVFSVLSAACALIEQPVPAGTRPIAARVHNGGSLPAEITVTVPTGVLPTLCSRLWWSGERPGT